MGVGGIILLGIERYAIAALSSPDSSTGRATAL